MLEIGKNKKLMASLFVTMGIFNTVAWAGVPAAPGSYIGVTDIDENTVRINFKDNSDNEQGFQVVGDINLNIPSNDASESPYVYANVSDLECDRVYTIQVLAYNDEGNSSLTDPRSFNIKSTFGVSCDTVESSLPMAPDPYIGVTDINKSAVRISLKDNANNETGFRVIGNDINLTLPAHDETQHPYLYADITGLTCDKLYQIEAFAFNEEGDSPTTEVRSFSISGTFNVDCDE